MQERTNQIMKAKPHGFINAFELIAMSSELDLSGLFHEQVFQHSKTNCLYCSSNSKY